MSVNVKLTGQVPNLVAPQEVFIAQIPNSSFSVESGNGYPGQGGCYYGRKGITFVSQFRVVYVETQYITPTFKSFSIPLYAIQKSAFYRGIFGYPNWNGVVSMVPGGGLVSSGKFQISVPRKALECFAQKLGPLIEASRPLAEEIRSSHAPAVALIPVVTRSSSENIGNELGSAFMNPSNPFKIYISHSK